MTKAPFIHLNCLQKEKKKTHFIFSVFFSFFWIFSNHPLAVAAVELKGRLAQSPELFFSSSSPLLSTPLSHFKASSGHTYTQKKHTQLELLWSCWEERAVPRSSRFSSVLLFITKPTPVTFFLPFHPLAFVFFLTLVLMARQAQKHNQWWCDRTYTNTLSCLSSCCDIIQMSSRSHHTSSASIWF